MSDAALSRQAAEPAGPVDVAAVAFRYQGALQVTVIAKASFALVADAIATRVAPAPIVRTEEYWQGRPSNSVTLTTDVAPYLTHADVIFTGSAHTPGDEPTESGRARLGLFDGPRPLLDKSVLLHKRGGYTTLELVYENAYGGAGWLENPMGTGAVDGTPEPNILDPEGPRRLAGFGPISHMWPARRKLLGGLTRKDLDAPVAAIPDGFDWAYFQAAPPDQRVPHLRGDEWIVTDGLHPTQRRFASRLPGAVGRARIHGVGAWGIADGTMLLLHPDTLRIDGEAWVASLTFRGTFPLAADAALASVRVTAGVELPGQPIAWPAMRFDVDRAAAADAPPEAGLIHAKSLVGTLTVTGDGVPPSAAAVTPWPRKSAPQRFDRTMDAAPPAAPALPFHASGASALMQTFSPPALVERPGRDAAERTLDLEDEPTQTVEAATAAPPSIAPAPAPAPPPEPVVIAAEPRRDPFRAEPERAPDPPAPAPPKRPSGPALPTPAQDVAVRRGLYDRFTPKR